MYRSYSYNNMPQPIIRREEAPPPPPPPPQDEQPKPEPAPRNIQKKPDSIGGFLKNLQTDDIILIAVIFALLIDDCDDKLLLIALGFIFFSDLM